MISEELLRRYPFFAGLTHDQIKALAMAGQEYSADAGFTFLKEEEPLSTFFLLLAGRAALTIAVPDRTAEQPKNNHITGDFITREIHIGTLEEGEIFGWSALLPPYEPTASVTALTPCRVVSIDRKALKPSLDEDCAFGKAMTIKAAQIIRDRLRARRIELLAEYA